MSAKHTPKVWKESSIVMIPKPGKDDYLNAKSFRPITLANHTLKLLEKLVLWHIAERNLKITPLSENQHAFRPGYSTESAALHVMIKIELAFEENKFAIGTFFDLRSL